MSAGYFLALSPRNRPCLLARASTERHRSGEASPIDVTPVGQEDEGEVLEGWRAVEITVNRLGRGPGVKGDPERYRPCAQHPPGLYQGKTFDHEAMGARSPRRAYHH